MEWSPPVRPSRPLWYYTPLRLSFFQTCGQIPVKFRFMAQILSTTWAHRVARSTISLRVTANAGSVDEARGLIDPDVAQIYQLLGPLVFG